MANPEHLAILKQGVKVWNEWRDSSSGNVPDLEGANLKGVDLTGAQFQSKIDVYGFPVRPTLCKANLTETILTEVDFREADLTGAILRRAFIDRTLLSSAILTGANLTGAYLSSVDMRSAYLTQVATLIVECPWNSE